MALFTQPPTLVRRRQRHVPQRHRRYQQTRRLVIVRNKLVCVHVMAYTDTTDRIHRLPVELVVDILALLDLSSLIIVSSLSRLLRQLCADPALNPWKSAIFRNLHSDDAVYEDALRNLAVRSAVPRNNWVDVLSVARAEYLLYELTLPVLSEADWQLCFKKRFLPDWARWKKDGRWKEEFLK